ncbi:hypothetical protein J7J41_02345 [bacterium]|nr:hypothetical protein [bacterium]
MNLKDLKNLREDLIGELEAINQYQKHIEETQNQKIKELLTHILNEEKEHVAEIIKLLKDIDEVQKEKFEKEEA